MNINYIGFIVGSMVTIALGTTAVQFNSEAPSSEESEITQSSPSSPPGVGGGKPVTSASTSKFKETSEETQSLDIVKYSESSDTFVEESTGVKLEVNSIESVSESNDDTSTIATSNDFSISDTTQETQNTSRPLLDELTNPQLQLFWGPFNSPGRADKFSDQIEKLTDTTMISVKQHKGYYIGFHYKDEEERLTVLERISLKTGLKLNLAQQP